MQKKKKCPVCLREECICIIKRSDTLLESNTVYNTFRREILTETKKNNVEKKPKTEKITILNG